MSELISGKELIDNHGIKKSKILDKIEQNELQPYNDIEKPVPCPKDHHKGDVLELELSAKRTDLYLLADSKPSHRKDKLLLNNPDAQMLKNKLQEKEQKIEAQLAEIEKNDPLNYSWKYFVRPKSDKSLMKIINEIPNYLFKVSDVEKHFSLNIGESSKKIEEIDNQNRAAILKGGSWEVFFDGNSDYLHDLPRVRYILRLLESPNKKFSHLDLQTIVSGKQLEPDKYYKNMSSEQLEKEGLTDNLKDIMIDTLQEHEIEGLETIAYKHWDKLMQKKPDAEKDWKNIRKHLYEEYYIKVIPTRKGLKFKLHKSLKPDAEKARVNVTKNISNALKDIEEKMPSLYEHLKNRIKTDGTCRYEIESNESTQWHIEWNK